MPEKNKVLLVEREDDLRVAISEQLDHLVDLDVFQAKDGPSALEAINDTKFDLLIIDLSSLNVEENQFCQIIGSNNSEIPIITLHGTHDLGNCIFNTKKNIHLELRKPFKINSLLESIQNLLFYFDHNTFESFNIGRLTIFPRDGFLINKVTKKKSRLTEKEISILEYLFASKKTVVGKDELLDEIWGYNSGVTTHTLETHIYRLRQKVERDPSNSRILLTVPGGYRLEKE